MDGWLHGFHDNPGRKASISAAAQKKRQSLPPDAFHHPNILDHEAIARRSAQAAQRRASSRPDMILNRKASVTAELIGASSKSKSRKKSVAEETPRRKRSFLGFGSRKEPKEPKESKDDSDTGSESAASPSALTRALVGRNASTSQIPDYPNGRPDDLLSPSPAREKDISRLGSAIRRLSSSGKNTALVPRRILNIDRGREKPSVAELNPVKLKRVAFSVDVEIAGRSRYSCSSASTAAPSTVVSGPKGQELPEGAVLKNPDLLKECNAEDEIVRSLPGTPPNEPSGVTRHMSLSPEMFNARKGSMPSTPPMSKRGSLDSSVPGLNKIAEFDRTLGSTDESLAQIPLSTTTSNNTMSDVFNSRPQSQVNMAASLMAPRAKPQDRPTHDPLRIYRRCCQLREAPVLKRISEQLANPASRSPESSEVVECLNLTKSRLQLQDFMCLGDWLAIVPVKKLLLDDAHLDDERLRIVLAGLLSTKTPELLQRRRGIQSRNRLLDMMTQRSPGVIEKLSFKNNPKISHQGWAHISLFLNLNKSIKSMDLSTLQFPNPLISAAEVAGPNKSGSSIGSAASLETKDIAELFTRALTGRLAGEGALEELVFNNCNLTTSQVELITKAATTLKLRNLGVAQNNLGSDSLKHISDFIRAGSCRALDLGGNDLRDNVGLLAPAISSKSSLWAFSLSRCNLQPSSLAALWPSLTELPDLRFLDLSHNTDLCALQTSVVPCLRKYLPRMKMLKRLHLMNVSMNAAQATAIAEVLPECRNIAHLNMLENSQLTQLMNNKDGKAQEEMCALFTSLMTAVKLSKTLVCIDIDNPCKECSDVAKALARQVVAYCLRNMERFAAASAERVLDTASALPDVSTQDANAVNSDLLFHIGERARFSEDQILSSDSNNEDFVVGGTGLVTALQYCLDAPNHRRASRDTTADPSYDHEAGKQKAKEVSKMLLNTARSVQTRLQPVIARESSGGDENALLRLRFLNDTLGNIIQRFEQEYPETRQPGPPVLPDPVTIFSDANGYESESEQSASSTRSNYNDLDPSSTNTSHSHEHEPFEAAVEDGYDERIGAAQPIRPSSRRGSNTSIASRHLEIEEGQMHKFGQHFRRHILPPKGMNDHLHGTSERDADEPRHLAVLRRKLENMKADELLKRVTEQGWEAVIRDFSDDAENLKRMSHRDSAELRNYVFNQMIARNDSYSDALHELLRKQDAVFNDSIFAPKSL